MGVIVTFYIHFLCCNRVYFAITIQNAEWHRNLKFGWQRELRAICSLCLINFQNKQRKWEVQTTGPSMP